MTTTATRVETHTVSGSDVRVVADKMWLCVQHIHRRYGRELHATPELRNELGQILLWDMAELVSIQFHDKSGVERLSYEFVPEAQPSAEDSAPDEFPTYEVQSDWLMRLIVRMTSKKPLEEVREFFDQLGWHEAPLLQRTGQGKTDLIGSFVSGGFAVDRHVYSDLPGQDQAGQSKEVQR